MLVEKEQWKNSYTIEMPVMNASENSQTHVLCVRAGHRNEAGDVLGYPSGRLFTQLIARAYREAQTDNLNAPDQYDMEDLCWY